MEPERAPPHLDRARIGDRRVARRIAHALAEAVGGPQADHLPRGAGQPHERPHGRGHRVPPHHQGSTQAALFSFQRHHRPKLQEQHHERSVVADEIIREYQIPEDVQKCLLSIRIKTRVRKVLAWEEDRRAGR